MSKDSEFDDENTFPFMQKRLNIPKINPKPENNLGFGVLVFFMMFKTLVAVVVWYIWNALSDNLGWPKLTLFEFFGFMMVLSFIGGIFNRKSLLK